jgi:beta-lactamase class A
MSDPRSPAELVTEAPGEWSYTVSRLDRDRRLEHLPDRERPSASLIKVPILAALYDLVEKERLRLDETVRLTREDQVGGSGVLQDLTPGTRWTLRDLATLMITVSDNTATNLLLDRITVETVNRTAESLGLSHTRVLRRLQRIPTGAVGMNHTTAGDMCRLMTLIAQGQAISRAASERMADTLRRCQAPAMVVPESLGGSTLVGAPPRFAVHHKTGLLYNLRADAGYVVGAEGGYAYALIAVEAPESTLEPWMRRIGAALAREIMA